MGLGGFQWEICFCVKRISYLEIKTQLLTFWKDMVVHQSKYHLVLQNGPGSKKVDGGDWGGDFWTFAHTENFFQYGVPPHPIETSATNVLFFRFRVVRGI